MKLKSLILDFFQCFHDTCYVPLNFLLNYNSRPECVCLIGPPTTSPSQPTLYKFMPSLQSFTPHYILYAILECRSRQLKQRSFVALPTPTRQLKAVIERKAKPLKKRFCIASSQFLFLTEKNVQDNLLCSPNNPLTSVSKYMLHGISSQFYFFVQVLLVSWGKWSSSANVSLPLTVHRSMYESLEWCIWKTSLGKVSGFTFI